MCHYIELYILAFWLPARAQDEGRGSPFYEERAARHHAQIAKFTKYRDSDHDAAAQLLRDANKLPEQMLTRNTLNYQRHHAQIAMMPKY
ncbi:hypothetical protein M431DRAFT_534028 [Trichoderma harzianum CBS 226.95]|uniref:Uncharacterized protein n=1 Tax=Trichoderma harzianum CBS 226.95 TaxID=983964 RepID=A0A2T3ZZX9_TRIHA|nr:hypothetical protein M431DRAFT_534028 [Trichoderma harzianum CBS 226.95]PTB50371.1 hypothetical protein M431DRAFT_534028 [Trichoderma harzianum CBS 226.95]